MANNNQSLHESVEALLADSTNETADGAGTETANTNAANTNTVDGDSVNILSLSNDDLAEEARKRYGLLVGATMEDVVVGDSR